MKLFYVSLNWNKSFCIIAIFSAAASSDAIFPPDVIIDFHFSIAAGIPT